MSDLSKTAQDAQRIWDECMKRRRFNTHEIAAEIGLPVDRVGKLVRTWHSEGLVQKLDGRGVKGRVIFRIAEQKKVVKPKRDATIHGNLWMAMRGLGEFCPTDLSAHATTDTLEVSARQANDYCRMLLNAGYLKVLRKAVPGRREARYRLIRNTGPKPPRERRVRAVYDDNQEQYVYYAGEAA